MGKTEPMLPMTDHVIIPKTRSVKMWRGAPTVVTFNEPTEVRFDLLERNVRGEVTLEATCPNSVFSGCVDFRVVAWSGAIYDIFVRGGEIRCQRPVTLKGTENV